MEQAKGMRFSPKRSKSRAFCSVYGCSSRASKDFLIRFHSFPTAGKKFVHVTDMFGNVEKVDSLSVWMRSLKMGKDVSPYMRVCSLHFTKDDYIFPG